MRAFATSIAMMLLVSGMCMATLTWTFDTEDDVASWGAWNQLDYAVENGVLRTESTGADPYFFPGGDWNVADWDPISGADHSSIYVRVKLETASTWQVYYVTEEDAAWGEVQRQNFDMEATGDFADVALIMERGGWQEHTVTHFRIDPGTEAGMVAEIDYISLESPVTPVESHGKLATLWASMRQ